MRDRIKYLGELVDYIKAAAVQHNASPLSEIRVRIGPNGAEYPIKQLVGCQDQRGISFVLEADVTPECG